MSAIVVNTSTGAVSEYQNFRFNSLTAGHMGSERGLFTVDAESDAGEPIVAEAVTPALLQKSLQKKRIAAVYVAAHAEGTLQVHVHGQKQKWQYPLPIREGGMSRATPGRGISETYLAVGVSNPAGQPFQIDSIAAEVVTSARHI